MSLPIIPSQITRVFEVRDTETPAYDEVYFEWEKVKRYEGEEQTTSHHLIINEPQGGRPVTPHWRTMRWRIARLTCVSAKNSDVVELIISSWVNTDTVDMEFDPPIPLDVAKMLVVEHIRRMGIMK